MVISYCDTCGVLVKHDSVGETVLCESCQSGVPAEPKQRRDSAMIPLARRPTSGTILRTIRENIPQN